MTRTRVTSARRDGDLWRVEVADTETGETRAHHARVLVNAAGPWVGDVLRGRLGLDLQEGVRLVRGSHIVTKRLFDHDKCYFFQGTDGRITFAIPFERDFTLIGTTERDHDDADNNAVCTPDEQAYLIDCANNYFGQDLTLDDIVWTYSGVRPLYDDGATSATAATRDYVLRVDQNGGAPVLNVFGGKITTYRRLAETALDKIAAFFPGMPGKWTARKPLPGGDFPVTGFDALCEALSRDYPFLDADQARRLARAYGTEARDLLGNAKAQGDLGREFGAGLTEAELSWQMSREHARHAEDVVWRRTKLGLRMSAEQIAALEEFMSAARKAAQ